MMDSKRFEPARGLEQPLVLEPPMQPGEFELAARHFRDRGQWPEMAQGPREAVVSRYRWLSNAR